MPLLLFIVSDNFSHTFHFFHDFLDIKTVGKLAIWRVLDMDLQRCFVLFFWGDPDKIPQSFMSMCSYFYIIMKKLRCFSV